MTAPREIELKLLLRPQQLPRLRRLPWWRQHGATRARSRELHSVYFDTADQALLRAGFALRVRRVGRGYVQTLKAAEVASAGLFERIEIESPVSAQAPELAAIDVPGLRERVRGLVAGEALVAVLETQMRRSSRLLEVGASRVQADLDVGEIRTVNGNAPLCELELELLAGEPAALYDCALALLEQMELRVGAASKFERGVDLLLQRTPSARRARPPALAPGCTLDDAIAVLLAECVAQIDANAAPARLDADPEGVHQMRVGVRRLRTALSLLRDALPAAATGTLRAELRWLARTLGAARDVDVYIDEYLAPVATRELASPLAEELLERARELRRQAHAQVAAALDGPRYARLMLDLGRFLARRAWRECAPLAPNAALFQDVEVSVAALLERCYRRARKLDALPSRLPPPRQHALRLRLKRLRYAAEFFAALYPGRARQRMVKRTRALQDVLGRLQDTVAVRQLGARMQHLAPHPVDAACSHALGYVTGWVVRDVAAGARDLDKRWRQFRRCARFWGAHGAS